MTHPFKYRSLCVVFAIAAMTLMSACAFMGSQADKRLGFACTDQVRFERASLLTDMLETHYGDELPAKIERLRNKTQLMFTAMTAGDGMDAAGDSYKADFVTFSVALLSKRGLKIAVGGYSDAFEHLKKLPELVADINEIEARVRIDCAELAVGT